MKYIKFENLVVSAFLLACINIFAQGSDGMSGESPSLTTGVHQPSFRVQTLDDGPLYIVSADGKEFRTTDKNAFMPSIENTQIESINILKNEAAVEQYGDAGKNGVVQINLKKGVLKTFPKTLKAKFK